MFFQPLLPCCETSIWKTWQNTLVNEAGTSLAPMLKNAWEQLFTCMESSAMVAKAPGNTESLVFRESGGRSFPQPSWAHVGDLMAVMLMHLFSRVHGSNDVTSVVCQQRNTQTFVLSRTTLDCAWSQLAGCQAGFSQALWWYRSTFMYLKSRPYPLNWIVVMDN